MLAESHWRKSKKSCMIGMEWWSIKRQRLWSKRWSNDFWGKNGIEDSRKSRYEFREFSRHTLCSKPCTGNATYEKYGQRSKFRRCFEDIWSEETERLISDRCSTNIMCISKVWMRNITGDLPWNMAGFGETRPRGWSLLESTLFWVSFWKLPWISETSEKCSSDDSRSTRSNTQKFPHSEIKIKTIPNPILT